MICDRAAVGAFAVLSYRTGKLEFTSLKRCKLYRDVTAKTRSSSRFVNVSFTGISASSFWSSSSSNVFHNMLLILSFKVMLCLCALTKWRSQGCHHCHVPPPSICLHFMLWKKNCSTFIIGGPLITFVYYATALIDRPSTTKISNQIIKNLREVSEVLDETINWSLGGIRNDVLRALCMGSYN